MDLERGLGGLRKPSIAMAATATLMIAVAPVASARVKVDSGDAHNCAVKNGGKVKCWGWNGAGQSSSPGGKFLSVSAGTLHTCGVRLSDRIACWGINSSGQSDVPAGLG